MSLISTKIFILNCKFLQTSNCLSVSFYQNRFQNPSDFGRPSNGRIKNEC